MERYTVGDQVEILRSQDYSQAPNGLYKKGEIHTVSGIDFAGNPWFEGDEHKYCWGNVGNWFRKIPQNSTCIEYIVAKIDGKRYKCFPIVGEE